MFLICCLIYSIPFPDVVSICSIGCVFVLLLLSLRSPLPTGSPPAASSEANCVIQKQQVNPNLRLGWLAAITNAVGQGYCIH